MKTKKQLKVRCRTEYFVLILGISIFISFILYPLLMINTNENIVKEKGESRLVVCNNEVFYDSVKVYSFIPITGGNLFVGDSCQMNYSNEELLPGHKISTNEANLRKVRVASFLLGDIEITHLFWDCVMEKHYKIGNNLFYNNSPVKHKSYIEWMEFIQRLEVLTGRKYRMPTLDEWDFAARGGIYSKGYKYAGGNEIDDVAYYKGNTFEDNMRSGLYYMVKRKKPNELGLYDMSGGVQEFTSTPPDDERSSMAMFFESLPKDIKEGKLSRGGDYRSEKEDCSLYHQTHVSMRAGARLVMEH